VPFPIMNVQVTTTLNNQRVKLDATLTTIILAMLTSSSFQYGIEYRLFRDTTQLTFDSTIGNYLRNQSISTTPTYSGHPNLTFVDIPGPAGTYNYQIVANDIVPRINIDIILIQNRGLTATVYPPA